MKSRLRLLQRRKTSGRFRLRTRIHWSTVVISALVFNLFFLTYLYLNLGVPEKAMASNVNNLTINSAPGVTVYPNPVPAGMPAIFEIPFEDAGSTVEVSMVDIEGKKILSGTIEKDTDSNTILFQAERFSYKGTFLVIVSGLENKTLKKFVVI